MLTITYEHIFSCLQSLGIQPGDGLLVHSALQFLGRPEDGVEMYLHALADVLNFQLPFIDASMGRRSKQSSKGTLAVPTFTFAFARGEAYDPAACPSQGMGAFSELVRQQAGALRTLHPMQSLAVLGRYAADLARRDTLSAFDPGSAFERMLELDFKLLLLGADIQAASMVHYCEQRLRVPYRYWKEFTGPVRTASRRGKDGWEQRTYRMYVRDLELDPRLNLSPIQRMLQVRGQWASQSLNYGQVSVCRLVDFVKAGDDLLSVDPWVLISNRPDK